MKKLITCLVVCVLSGATFATTWTVDDSGKADFDNIQAAVDAASDGDEIVVAPGTYTSTAAEVVNMRGKEIWLHSSKGAEVTIIDGEETHRGILCDNGETPKTIIEGFTITNGYADYGGGMYIDNGSPTLTNCTFENNTCKVWNSYSLGGGMYNGVGSPTLTNCTFENNTSIGEGGNHSSGGGMYNGAGSPTLTDCTFTGNVAGGSWTSGGGMSGGNATLTNCTFIDNRANYGGGMSGGATLTGCAFENNTALDEGGGASVGNATLTDCTFTSNSAYQYGGGVITVGNGNATLTDCTFTGNTGSGMYNRQSSPTLTNCIFTGNTGGNGGGMCNSNSNPTLINCTFENNAVSGNGGGMCNSNSNPTLINCIITSNLASTGGGMWNWSESNPTLTDNSICENSPDQIFGDWHGEGNIVSEVCPWNQGACCTNDNCLVSEQENCLAFFGEWQGEDTTCADNPCPTTCLGDVTGDGVVDVSDLLAIIAVWGACP
ncbi:MAG: hypothetical protein HOI88_00820 [Phycisphaerae bacterium]|nr:hypothetical protein [Phycisphaerae bacterium]